jgi:hypothetical protein
MFNVQKEQTAVLQFSKAAVENSNFGYNQTISDTLYEGIFFRTAIIQNKFNFMSDYMVTPIFQIMNYGQKFLALCLGNYSMLHKYSANHN